MVFIRQSFAMLFWRPLYALAFYLTAGATLASAIMYARSTGISERAAVWGALALVLPLNIVFCGVWRLAGDAQLRLTDLFVWLVTDGRKVGVSKSAQKRILLAADYIALVAVVWIFGAICSSITTAIFIDINQADQSGGFPWGLYAKVIAIELSFMLLVVLIPAIMIWLWAPPAVRKREERLQKEPGRPLARTAWRMS